MIRPARPDEAQLLSDLALRSKAYWPYPPAFIEACRADLTVTPVTIIHNPVFVSENTAGHVAGFYVLAPKTDGVADLAYLFVAPEAIGGGHGRALFEHAVRTARALGYRELHVDSDPYAEPFYLRMGAERIGEAESTVIPGRMLPLLRYLL
jgi:GNAT superfamily N-acetyltransferase